MDPVTWFFILTGCVLFLWNLKRKIYWIGETNIPGPKGWPLLGNAGYFFRVTTGEMALQALKRMTSETGNSPLSRVWLGPKLCILVQNEKYMEPLLNHRGLVNKDIFFYQPIQQAGNNGIFTRSTTEGWHKMRKPLATFLLPKNMPNFQQTVCLKTYEMLIPELEKHVGKEPFHHGFYIKALSLEIILMASLGIEKLDGLVDDKFRFVEVVDEEVEKMTTTMMTLKYQLGLHTYNPKTAHTYLGQLARRVMKEMKNRLEERGGDVMTEQPENYAEVLIKIGKEGNMSESGTAQLLGDYLVAGTDTQAVIIVSTLFYLAIHQEFQAKVANELFNIFGDSTRDPHEGDLKNMVYLEMCIKETMRLCGPAVIGRLAEEDIEIDGYRIPKGSGVAFCYFAISEDPKCWEKPEAYYPDHFLPEANSKRPKGAFLPFASGPKGCPGQSFSWISMKSIISTLMRNYHWTSDEKFENIQYKLILMREPANPRVKLTRRVWPVKETFADHSDRHVRMESG